MGHNSASQPLTTLKERESEIVTGYVCDPVFADKQRIGRLLGQATWLVASNGRAESGAILCRAQAESHSCYTAEMGTKACRAQAEFHYYCDARLTAAEQGEESHHAELMQNIIAVQHDIDPLRAHAQSIACISVQPCKAPTDGGYARDIQVQKLCNPLPDSRT
jgi:hypothetical protein